MRNAANLIAITSQLTGDLHSIVLSDGDFEDGSLPKESRAKVSKVFTIHSALIAKKLCRVTPGKLKEVLAAVRRFYSSEAPVEVTRTASKFSREGDLAAEVLLDWIESEDDWQTHLSVKDAQTLDDVREALRRGDLDYAAKRAQVFRLTPIDGQSRHGGDSR